MRMRNPKYKDEILSNCDFYLDENLFENKNKIHMEIGMGKGDFILNMALKYPDINFIGIEKYSSVAAVAIKKISEYDLQNIKVLVTDVIKMPEYIYGKIDTIYLNFSDPWPKARHEKRRLTNINQLMLYDKFFGKKCTIIQKTDNVDLFNYSISQYLEYGYTIINKSNDLHNENIDNVETEYEKKFSTMGYPINYIKVEKNND